jgi:cell shape-determining protein MreD
MTLRRILYIALLFVLQVIANDYLNLGPYIYVCFLPVMIMIAPVERSSIQSMFIAFGLGLLVDLLSDGVLGLNAAAGVFMAGAMQFIFIITVNDENYDRKDCPTLYDVGTRKFLRFLIFSMLIYFAVYVLLDCIGTRTFIFFLERLAATVAVDILFAIIVNIAFFRRID